MPGPRCDICWRMPVRSYGAVCWLCRGETAAEKLQRRAEQATKERQERLAQGK